MFTGQLASFTNREDWEFTAMDVWDDDAEEAVDLSDATITYGIYDSDGCQLLTGETGDGTITLPEDTVFQITIPLDSVSSFEAGTYKMGITILNADETRSVFSGTISVIDGNVP